MKRNLVLSILFAFSLLTIGHGCGPQIAGGGQVSGGGTARVSGTGTGGFDTSCRKSFGTNASARKLKAFIDAAYAFNSTATEIQGTLLGACRKMGRALEMSDAELAGQGVDATRNVCRNVSNRLQAELAALRGQAGITVTIHTRPPRCTVDVDAAARCSAECDVRVDPGKLDVECTGGELRGGCSAECSGSCALDVEARCEGTCEGVCEGQCSATAADGSCAGQCSGTCRGQCVARVSGGCSGECRGGCSVQFTKPKCTGTVRPPSASAECNASCDARLKAEVDCEPGQVDVTIAGTLGPDFKTRATRLTNALKAGMGQILTIRARVERLRESGAAVVRLAGDLKREITSLGLGAVGCVGSSLSALQKSMASVTVSVEVSVQVSGSVAVR